MQTDFLYPISIEIRTENKAWRWAWLFHLSTVGITVFFLPYALSAAVTLVTLVSLRNVWDAQAAIRRSTCFTASGAGRWYLLLANDRRDYVRLDSISFIGNYFVVCLRKNGTTCHIIDKQSTLTAEQLHKIRLMRLHHVAT